MVQAFWRCSALAVCLLLTQALFAQTYVQESSGGYWARHDSVMEVRRADGVPMEQWVGKRFVILPKPKYLQRYGYNTLRHPNGGYIIPNYDECAGKIATVTDVESGPYTDYKVTLRLDNGEEYTAVSASGIFSEIAPYDDVEHARTEWNGKRIWITRGPIYVYHADTGRMYMLTVRHREAVTVKDVETGWNSNRPVRLLVVTEDGHEGFVDVQYSSTNVIEPLRGRNRSDVYFSTEDQNAY